MLHNAFYPVLSLPHGFKPIGEQVKDAMNLHTLRQLGHDEIVYPSKQKYLFCNIIIIIIIITFIEARNGREGGV